MEINLFVPDLCNCHKICQEGTFSLFQFGLFLCVNTAMALVDVVT